ncbi:MAG: hypothetical protein OEY86_17370 [Nitrospira sp.]|nr:hypothetical protein [Nitrospira sp.]
MFRQVPARLVALIAVFTLCQVIGVMCALPDLSQAQEATFVEDRMACPMEGAIMCPPSLISSHERQVKPTVASNVDQAVIQPCLVQTERTDGMCSVLWSRSSAFFIVPISIESSSVLRI